LRVYSTPQALLGSGPSEFHTEPITGRLQPVCSLAVTYPAWIPSRIRQRFPTARPARHYPLRTLVTTWTLTVLRRSASILGFGRPRNVDPGSMRLIRHTVSPAPRDCTSHGLPSFRVSLPGDPGASAFPSWGSAPSRFFCRLGWHLQWLNGSASPLGFCTF
jgi:hypothetical protein